MPRQRRGSWVSLMGGTLVLHENDEIGDAIGEVRVISVEDTPSGV